MIRAHGASRLITAPGAFYGPRAKPTPPSKRVCSWPTCATVLSRYNPADRCGVHEAEGDPAALTNQHELTPDERRAYRDGSWLR